MHMIMGGTGHVGASTADALLHRGAAVTILTRNPSRHAAWQHRGALLRRVDVNDSTSLRDAFRAGTRALLLVPPADPGGDTDAQEHRAVDAILQAVDASALEKVVAVSTYGARPGERIGDLGTLWRLEDGLAQLSVPTAVNRHAYYFTNWVGLLANARETGVLPSMLPADLVLPMVAPSDLGEAAAQRLVAPVADIGVEYIEGPERYSPAHVAAAFADRLRRPVRVEPVASEQLDSAFRALGFSAAAAASYAGMTRATIASPTEPKDPWRGRLTLSDFLAGVGS